jgi:hypothetical protein
VSQTETRDTFSTGWRVDSIVPTGFATLLPVEPSPGSRAWLASLTRLDGEVRATVTHTRG